MRFVYGLKGLIVVESGKVTWAVRDPAKFVSRVLPRIAGAYDLVINMAGWDPRKISKDPDSYEYAVRQFQYALSDEQRTAHAA
jgi:hypothetical protein